jgi:hypothetical protein
MRGVYPAKIFITKEIEAKYSKQMVYEGSAEMRSFFIAYSSSIGDGT